MYIIYVYLSYTHGKACAISPQNETYSKFLTMGVLELVGVWADTPPINLKAKSENIIKLFFTERCYYIICFEFQINR